MAPDLCGARPGQIGAKSTCMSVWGDVASRNGSLPVLAWSRTSAFVSVANDARMPMLPGEPLTWLAGAPEGDRGSIPVAPTQGLRKHRQQQREPRIHAGTF